MPVASIDQLVSDVEAQKTVVQSAVNLINGFSGRLDQAIKDALAGGATAAELAPLTGLSADIKSHNEQLADAVQANTPV